MPHCLSLALRFFLLVCRCHIAFFWSYVFFLFSLRFFLFRYRPLSSLSPSLNPWLFVQSCFDINGPGSYTQLANNCQCPLFSFSFLLWRCRFSRVFLYHRRFLFVWKGVVRSFLPGGVFLLIPCDHGLDFDISLCENSFNLENPTSFQIAFEMHPNCRQDLAEALISNPDDNIIQRYFQHAHFILIVGVGKRGEY